MTTKMTLKDFYAMKKSNQGPTANGWHHIQAKIECDTKFKLAGVCGLRKPLAMTPDPLAKGSLFHVGRAAWYEHKFKTDTKTYRAVREAMEKAQMEAPVPISSSALAAAWDYVEQYILHWCVRPLPKVVGVEYDIGPVPLKKDDPWWLNRTARLDDVSHYPEAPNGALCIGECKTTSVGADDCENEYTLHGQLLMQFMLWRMAPNGEAKHGPASYVMLDIVKKGYGKEKCTFARVPIHVTLTSLNWYVPMMNRELTEAARITETSPTHRRITSCTKQIGRMRVPCEFRDLCRFGDKAASAYVDKDGVSASKKYANAEVKPWD